MRFSDESHPPPLCTPPPLPPFHLALLPSDRRVTVSSTDGYYAALASTCLGILFTSPPLPLTPTPLSPPFQATSHPATPTNDGALILPPPSSSSPSQSSSLLSSSPSASLTSSSSWSPAGPRPSKRGRVGTRSSSFFSSAVVATAAEGGPPPPAPPRAAAAAVATAAAAAEVPRPIEQKCKNKRRACDVERHEKRKGKVGEQGKKKGKMGKQDIRQGKGGTGNTPPRKLREKEEVEVQKEKEKETDWGEKNEKEREVQSWAGTAESATFLARMAAVGALAELVACIPSSPSAQNTAINGSLEGATLASPPAAASAPPPLPDVATSTAAATAASIATPATAAATAFERGSSGKQRRGGRRGRSSIDKRGPSVTKNPSAKSPSAQRSSVKGHSAAVGGTSHSNGRGDDDDDDDEIEKTSTSTPISTSTAKTAVILPAVTPAGTGTARELVMSEVARRAGSKWAWERELSFLLIEACCGAGAGEGRHERDNCGWESAFVR